MMEKEGDDTGFIGTIHSSLKHGTVSRCTPMAGEDHGLPPNQEFRGVPRETPREESNPA